MGLKILIIDDDPDVREFLVSYLKKHKYDTISAANKEEAIEAIKHFSPDIVFCDIKPERDGKGLVILKEAKEIKPEIIFYIIMNPDREIETLALSLGAKEILFKPILPQDLEQKIKEDGRKKSYEK